MRSVQCMRVGCWIFNLCVSVYFLDACCIASKMLFTDYTWNSVVKNMRHIYLNKLCCTCFDFLFTFNLNSTHTNTPNTLRYKEARLYARSHDTLAVHICTDVCMRMHDCVWLFACTHIHKHENEHGHKLQYIFMCVEVVRCCLYIYQWLEAPSRNTRIRRNNVKCTKIYQHTQPNKPVSV